jgi:hypothetical protein
MKPANLSVITIHPINIGLTVITRLEIDLIHINHGLDPKTKVYRKNARSFLTEIEVANIFGMLDTFYLSSTDKKGDYLYFSELIIYVGKTYNISFCINRNNINTAGIITLYMIKKRK